MARNIIQTGTDGKPRRNLGGGAGPAIWRPGYWTISSLSFVRCSRPTLAHGLPLTMTTSAVKSKLPRNNEEPTPYASTGTFRSSNSRILATVNPPETTILTWLKPSASSDRVVHDRLGRVESHAIQPLTESAGNR